MKRYPANSYQYKKQLYTSYVLLSNFEVESNASILNSSKHLSIFGCEKLPHIFEGLLRSVVQIAPFTVRVEHTL